MEQPLLHVALFFILLGFIARDQIIMRTLIAIGQSLFVLNYILNSASLLSPVWWHILFVLINVIVVSQIYFERKTHKFIDREQELYRFFDSMNPGEFKKLIKIINWHNLKRKKMIARQDKKLDRLYFITNGKVEIRKNDKLLNAKGPIFIGELTFLTKALATADVTAFSKARLVSWDIQELQKLLSTRPQMRISFNNLINKDLALKLKNT